MAKEPSALARKVSGEVVSQNTDESLAIGLTRAEIDQQIATAKKYPRLISKVIANVTELATLDEEGAASMIFEKPQGGDVVRGASIRFAELLFSGWGNARAASRVVHIDRTEGFIEAVGIFHDLETNAATVLSTRRNIKKANGEIYKEDLIITVSNAACSIARRNAILGGIPKPVWRKPYEAAQQVVKGELGTLAARRAALLNYLKANHAIEPARALAAIGITNQADMILDHLMSLRVRAETLKNKDATVDELFPPVAALGAPVKEKIADKLPRRDEPKDGDKPESGGFDGKRVASDIDTASPPAPKAAEETPHDPKTGEVIEGQVLNAGEGPVDDEESFACLDSIAGPAPRGESYTLLDDDDDGETLPLYIDGVEVGRVNPEQSAEYNAYTEHAPTDEEAAASPQVEAGADLPDGWEALKDVDGPAPIGEEFYILAGDVPDEKTLRLTTYRNGVAASSCGKVGAAKLVRYTSHPVIEGGAARAQAAENAALAEPGDDEGFPGDRPPPGGDGGDELPGAFGIFWAAAFSGDPPWADFVKAWGDLNKSGDWTDLEDDDDRNAFRAKIAAKLLALNRLPDVTSNITAFRLWLEFASDGEVIAEKWRELKQSDVWAKFKADRQAEFRTTVEQRLAKIGGA